MTIYDKLLILMLSDKFHYFACLLPRHDIPLLTITFLLAGDVGENLAVDTRTVNFQLPKFLVLVADGDQTGIFG